MISFAGCLLKTPLLIGIHALGPVAVNAPVVDIGARCVGSVFTCFEANIDTLFDILPCDCMNCEECIGGLESMWTGLLPICCIFSFFMGCLSANDGRRRFGRMSLIDGIISLVPWFAMFIMPLVFLLFAVNCRP